MFNQQEVQILLGGVNAPIDLEDLRTNTQYGGLYDDHQPTVEAFWNVCRLPSLFPFVVLIDVCRCLC